MKAVYCMGKVQKAAEEMSYAWHRPEYINGYCLSLSK